MNGKSVAFHAGIRAILYFMFQFNKKYFSLSVLLFLTEVFIAIYVRDRFIRPYVGDFLVVILLYCALRAFIKTTPLKAAIAVLIFSFLVEWLQYFQIVNRLGLSDNIIAKTVIGYGFEWLDLLAYSLGVVFVLLVDKEKENKK